MTGITHLRSIDIAATDPAELLPFYERTWGLEQVPDPTAPDGGIALRARGTEHHVLRLVPGAGRALGRIALGAATPADVDRVAAKAGAAGAAVLTEPGVRADGGYTVELSDPEGRVLEVGTGLPEHREPARRAFGPDRLSHVVLNSPDLDAARTFYTDVLGFTVSDTYENDLMVFLRCNSQHHCVVLAPGEWATLNHVAFEVRDTDEVMRSLGRMRKAGFDTIWGPGRHGPGGNVFCYFQDPVGNVIEYTSDLIEVGPDWQAHAWPRTQENADVWGTSGGITPTVARAMANPPTGAQR
ncbi:VOC family protein [Kitasatospora sp. NPDC094016]|uniref:VOC family protein n=1 Tax=Kitasatospora sp. NPDC094016 TaxID=3154986 RepID=UPI00332617B8